LRWNSYPSPMFLSFCSAPRHARSHRLGALAAGSVCLVVLGFCKPAWAGTITITSNLPAATVSLSYTGTITASGGTAPYQFSATALPPGLKLNDSSGIISGTPNTAGTFNFTVTVTDKPHQDQGQSSLSITVNPKPVVSVTVTPSTAELHSYHPVQFSATVNNAVNQSVTWTSTAGTINSSGLFSAPLVYVNTVVTVNATSVAFPSKSGTASVTVTPKTLSILTTAIPPITAGTPYSFGLTAAGGFPPYKWTVVSGALPAGITISNTTSSLGGTATKVGQYSFTLRVSDSARAPQTASVNMMATVLRNPPAMPASFFGLHISLLSSPWPNTMGVSFAGLRSIASHINWSDINTADGVYDWTLFDSWFSNVEANHQDFLYTVFSTPSWASSNPTDPCSGGTLPSGACDPPDDVNADGSGTDDHLQKFIAALMAHVGVGRIKYVEIWDEPNITQNWTGSYAQLIRMTHDISEVAKGFDPNVQISGPPETGDGRDSSQMNWLAGFFADGGGQTMDVVGFHCYAWAPEDLVARIASLQTVSLSYGQQSKPVFCTEGSWGLFDNLTDPDQQAAFIARQMLLLVSEHIARFYWYAWDTTDSGNLYNPNTGLLSGAGSAYIQLHQWILGVASMGACTSAGTVWTCTLTRPGGYEAMAVWDSSQTCNNGVCTTSNFDVPAPYTQYHDLSGNLVTDIGSQVAIGLKPILLENMSAW
jgi:hypothetical protein